VDDFLQGGADNIDVAVIGGGPSGLAAATELKKQGVSRVVVLEREPQAGGIPRHCGHPPFGMREFKRILSGPIYAARLVENASAAGAEILTSTHVVEARPDGHLLIANAKGIAEIKARRVIYATGVRETPRSARKISGDRPLGVINTGALQSMVYLEKRKPFARPVIIGSELVSFSAIMTCRHAGIRPVAMIEARHSVTARWPSSLFPPLVGVPLGMATRLVSIHGDDLVNGIVVENPNGVQRRIECDGVILTGQFMPESSLALCGHLEVDAASGGPLVDQFGRCTDPSYFATGNVLRPVETAGWSWNEGRNTGRWVAADLAGDLTVSHEEILITTNSSLIKYFMPQKIVLSRSGGGMANLQLRFSRSARGELIAGNSDGVVWSRKLVVHPERRVLVPLGKLFHDGIIGRIELTFRETQT